MNVIVINNSSSQQHDYGRFCSLIQGPWEELDHLVVPAAYRAPAAQRPAELKYLKTRITYSELFGTKPTWDHFVSRLKGIGLRTAIADLAYIIRCSM